MSGWLDYMRRIGSVFGRDRLKQQLVGSEDPTGSYKPTLFYRSELIVNKLPMFTLYTARLMEKSDPIVTFAMNIRNAALMAGEVEVTGKNQKVVEWVQKQWKAIWEKHGQHLINGKRWGFSALQPLFKMQDNLIGIRGFKRFAPQDVRAILTDGEVTGFRVRDVKMHHPRALWQTFNSDFGLPYGTPLTKRMYPPWWEKWMDHGAKKLGQLRMIKDAWMGDVFEYPHQQVLQIPDGAGGMKVVPWRDVVREMAENRLSGAALTIPMVFDKDGRNLVKYTPPQAIPGGTDIFDWEDRLDEQILYGGDISIEVIKAPTSGSGYSGRSIPFLVTLSTCTQEFKEIVSDVDKHLLRPMAWLNFGGEPEYEITAVSLVKSFSDDASGSPMGGAAIGGQPGQQPPPQQEQPPNGRPQNGSAVQFSELGGRERLLAHLNGNGQVDESEQYAEMAHAHIDFTAEPGSHSYAGIKNFHKAVKQHRGIVHSDTHVSVPAARLDAFHKTASHTGFEHGRDYRVSESSQHAEQTHHAPSGGVTIQGRKFKGGEFIPSEVFNSLSAVDKAKLSPHLLKSGAGTAVADEPEPEKPESKSEPKSAPEKVTFLDPSSASDDEWEAAAIPPGKAEKMVAAVRAGRPDSKNKGVDGGREFIKEPLVPVSLPLAMFDDEYRQFLKESTTPERIRDYAGRKIDEPVFAMPRRKGGGWQVSDGGHRVMAAIERGDDSINALVPVSSREKLQETSQHSEGYDEDSHGATLLHKHGFERSGSHGTQGYWHNKQHGLITHYSNGSWQHHNRGKLVREGVSHRDLKRHLQGLSTQHDEIGGAVRMTDVAADRPPEDKPPAVQEVHKYSCTMFKLPGELAFDVRQLGDLIPHEDLAGSGRDLDPHVTILFGLHTDDPEEVRAAVQDQAPVAFQFGKASHFSGEDADVVKIEIESKALHQLHDHIAESLENTATHPIYKPHCTISYVRTGLGEFYANKLNTLKGRVAVFDRMTFSDKRRNHYSVPLIGTAQFAEDDQQESTEQIAAAGAAKSRARIQEVARRIREMATAEFSTLQTIAFDVETEIAALQRGLASDLSASMLGGELVGQAQVWTDVPLHFLAPMTERQETPTGEAHPPPPPPAEPPPTLHEIMGPQQPPPAVHFPVVADAIEVLHAAPAVARPDFRATAQKVREGAFAITGDLTDKAVADVKDILQENIAKGPDREAFVTKVLERLQDEGPLSEARVELIFRQNVGAALSDGMDRAAKHPMVADAFPYRALYATTDARCRGQHLAMQMYSPPKKRDHWEGGGPYGLDGTNIYRADDKVFNMFRGPWDFSCRCTWSVTSVEQAAAAGVKEAQEWLERAKAMAAEKGGSEYQYFVATAPASPQFVDPPPFKPSPEFVRQ